MITFDTIFVNPILNILVAFYKLFLLVKLPGAFGFAIIALTFVVRFILYPLNKKQIETTKKMQELQPHLTRLQDKHKDDKTRLQQEQMRLYKEAGLNPASGCLFAIVQIPVFIGLYKTLEKFLLNDHGAASIAAINKVVYATFLKINVIEPWFFGYNLALSPQKAKLWYYFIIPVVTAGLQYLQVQYSTPQVAPVNSKSGPSSAKASEGKGDFQKAMNTQMKFMFPVMLGWFAYTLPVGLSLYWNILTIFGIIQYRRHGQNKDNKS